MCRRAGFGPSSAKEPFRACRKPLGPSFVVETDSTRGLIVIGRNWAAEGGCARGDSCDDIMCVGYFLFLTAF